MEVEIVGQKPTLRVRDLPIGTVYTTLLADNPIRQGYIKLKEGICTLDGVIPGFYEKVENLSAHYDLPVAKAYKIKKIILEEI